MKIYIGSDHSGFELKEKLIPFLRDLGHEVEDKGPHQFDKDDDYPDFIRPVAEAVARDIEAKGIIIGKSGEGEAMAANRERGVRAAVYYGNNLEVLKLSREHNDANVLSLAAGFVPADEAASAVKLWLNTPFSEEERHIRRIAKLD
ncbi:RpiB/LacA/LacB family sugar-phosphate isomerase [Candidatus Parcubacteria bacterium]|nr:RpiB/LacA/LacB family sugar-phosphate isomerase [Candidatus Parcubacteria bacterium]